MASRSANDSVPESEQPEWSKLAPAISKDSSEKRASSSKLLNARRPETPEGLPAEPWARETALKSDRLLPEKESPRPRVAPEETTSPVALVEPETEQTEVYSDSALNWDHEDLVATQSAQAHETAVIDPPAALPLRSFLMTIAVPVVTLMLAIHMIASSAFMWLAYHRPGFPADQHGLSTDERMTYGSYGLDYIKNFAPKNYLADLKTSQGNQLFLESEVQHMTDVRTVLLWSTVVAIILLLLAIFASRSLKDRAPGVVKRSMFWGAIITLVLMIVLGIFGAFGWTNFFETFHKIFFPQGNWQFRESDTLIRLYPPQFWVDSALAIALIALVISAIILIATWPTKFRREVANRRAAERLEVRDRLTEGF